MEGVHAVVPYRVDSYIPGYDYRVVDVLGAGAFGVVLTVADDAMDGTLRALKLSKTRLAPGVRLRLREDCRELTQIKHPHVVHILTAGATKDAYDLDFVVMEMLFGKTLRQMLRGMDEPVGPERTLDIGMELLDGLSAMHARGIVHRDIKPENVMLEGSTWRASVTKLLDLGAARRLSRPLFTPHGQMEGSEAYAAPELVTEPATVASDLYSVGLVLYEMLTRRHPFNGEASWVARDRPPPSLKGVPLLPRNLGYFITEELLSTRPERRPPSALDALEMLKRFRRKMDAAHEDRDRIVDRRLAFVCNTEPDQVESVLWRTLPGDAEPLLAPPLRMQRHTLRMIGRPALPIDDAATTVDPIPFDPNLTELGMPPLESSDSEK